MGFFDAIGRGFSLTKSSLRVAFMDPELLVLPVISTILLIAIVLSFFVPVFLSKGSTTVLIIAGFFSYLALFFSLYFTQAMIVESARIRFAGGNPKLADGFKAALKHLKSILVLAVIGAIISIIVNAIQRRARQDSGLSAIATHLVAGLIGASWTIVSYFSLPVILSENTSATQSFKRSMELFGKTWGENAVSNISLMALWLPAILFLVLGLFISPLFLILAVLAFVIGGIFHSVAKGILSQALYEYAKTGSVPQGFEQDAVKNFYEKK